MKPFSKTKKTVVYGLMLAMIFIVTAVEHSLPPLPFLPPGTRLGLANVVALYCLFFMGRWQAMGLNALKALFVLLTRGSMAGLLSFCGGMLSIVAVILLIRCFKDGVSLAAVGVTGAVVHNMGQYAAVSLLVASPFMIYYIPWLLAAGLFTGLATGAIFKTLLPFLRKCKNLFA